MMISTDLEGVLELIEWLASFREGSNLYIGNADVYTADGDDHIAILAWDTEQEEYTINPA